MATHPVNASQAKKKKKAEKKKAGTFAQAQQDEEIKINSAPLPPLIPHSYGLRARLQEWEHKTCISGLRVTAIAAASSAIAVTSAPFSANLFAVQLHISKACSLHSLSCLAGANTDPPRHHLLLVSRPSLCAVSQQQQCKLPMHNKCWRKEHKKQGITLHACSLLLPESSLELVPN